MMHIHFLRFNDLFTFFKNVEYNNDHIYRSENI